MRELLLDRLQAGDADLEVREACVALGGTLEIKDSAFVGAAKRTMLARMSGRRSRRPCWPSPGDSRILWPARGPGRGRLLGASGAVAAGPTPPRVPPQPRRCPPGPGNRHPGAATAFARRGGGGVETILDAIPRTADSFSLTDLARAFVALAERLDTAQADELAERSFGPAGTAGSVEVRRGGGADRPGMRHSGGPAWAAQVRRWPPRRLHEALAPAGCFPTTQAELVKITAVLVKRLDAADAPVAAERLLPLVLRRLQPQRKDDVSLFQKLALVSNFLPLAAHLKDTAAAPGQKKWPPCWPVFRTRSRPTPPRCCWRHGGSVGRS